MNDLPLILWVAWVGSSYAIRNDDMETSGWSWIENIGACLQEGYWVECLVDHLYAQFNSKNLNMPACILHQRILVIFV